MADLENRVAKLEVRMDIGGARDSATLTVIGEKLADLDTKLGQVQETVTNLAIKVENLETKVDNLETKMDAGFDEILRRLPQD
ncbi:hypothetical protein ACFVMC_24820 [Nocardia sp. NPDC127579]|uniref:hypothetical protein n=1 Tax=Nocardia sp. NPDC127579 TaxID=3345402 RepID=UPI00363FD378